MVHEASTRRLQPLSTRNTLPVIESVASEQRTAARAGDLFRRLALSKWDRFRDARGVLRLRLELVAGHPGVDDTRRDRVHDDLGLKLVSAQRLTRCPLTSSGSASIRGFKPSASRIGSAEY